MASCGGGGSDGAGVSGGVGSGDAKPRRCCCCVIFPTVRASTRSCFSGAAGCGRSCCLFVGVADCCAVVVAGLAAAAAAAHRASSRAAYASPQDLRVHNHSHERGVALVFLWSITGWAVHLELIVKGPAAAAAHNAGSRKRHSKGSSENIPRRTLSRSSSALSAAACAARSASAFRCASCNAQDTAWDCKNRTDAVQR